MVKKNSSSVCYSFIKEGSMCCDGMVRCCGIINCIRKYTLLQYNYFHIHGITYTKEQRELYKDLFKTATGISIEEYNTPEFWKKRFTKRKNGKIEAIN